MHYLERQRQISMICRVYQGDKFAQDIKTWPDKKIYSMYTRLLSAGKFKGMK